MVGSLDIVVGRKERQMVLVDVVDLVCAFCSRHDSVFPAKIMVFGKLAIVRSENFRAGLPANPPETQSDGFLNRIISAPTHYQQKLQANTN